MATRNTKASTIVLSVCYVKRSKEDLLSLIEAQIVKGQNILNQYPPVFADPYGRQLISDQDADKFYAEHSAWKEYCEEVYTSSFSDPNTKYLKQFQDAGTFWGIITDGKGQAYLDTRSLFQDEINALESFKQRLDLIFPM